MKLLISLLIVFIICELFGKSIKKHGIVWMVSLMMVSFIGMIMPASAPIWLQQIVTGFITRGTLATAMFIWVMYARILPKGTKVMANFMTLRAYLAIGAALMILFHNVFYVAYYIRRALSGNAISVYERLAGTCAILMWVLLLPLTITSFMPVRRKMNPVRWKKLQRLSYIFYGLIYVHVCLLFSKQILSGHANYGFELAVYTAVFGFYLVERVALYLDMSKKALAGALLARIGEPVLAVLCACIILVPYISVIGHSGDVAVAELAENINSVESAAAGTNSGDVLGAERTSDSGKESEAGDESFAKIVEDEAADSTSYKDGTYTGSGMGYNGPVEVEVTIEGSVIIEVKVTASDEDDPYYTWVLKQIPDAIVEKGSADVDTVSGATTSSKALISAVKDALEKASE